MAYDPQWPRVFAREAQRLRDALGERIRGLEHHGSTAVPGLSAKPIIDILLDIDDLAEVSAIKPKLEALGYDHAPRAGVPNHEVFGLGEPRRVLVHLVRYEGLDWLQNLWFRDSLRGDPSLAAEYARLKRELAAVHAHDRVKYTDAKSQFIARIRSSFTK